MAWPAIGWVIHVLFMFAGGCTGSTTGGIKMSRHLLALKNLNLYSCQVSASECCSPIKLNGKISTRQYHILNAAVFIIYILIITLSGILIMALTGIPAQRSCRC